MTSHHAPTRGLVLGKFLPPHEGHLHLIEFARAYASELTIVVGTLAREPIPGDVRFGWMKELCGSFARVVHLDEELPQDPSEHPDFWSLWERSLRRAHPDPIDYVFTSDAYGGRLAEVLGAEWVPVDPARAGVAISATAIRAEPLAHWSMLPRCVRPWFVKRVVVFGPESTGKSTLAADLAARFETVMVPEYARSLLEATAARVDDQAMERIVRGQRATEDALAKSANRILVCDTDVLTTTVWWDILLGHCPAWVTEEARRRPCDLTFLTDIDVPWEPDPIRFRPDDRAAFLARCEATLEAAKRPYVKLSGSREARLAQAADVIARSFGLKDK